MAITATFTANFASFYDAVRQADAKLKDFGTGADKVGGQLNRMAESLSGRRMVQEAAVMVQAVEAVGGVSRLTATELERVAGKAAEAAEKMKKLGMEVPSGLQDLADAGQKSKLSLDGMVGSIASVAAGFLTAQAVIGGLTTVWNLFSGFVVGSVKSASDAQKAQEGLTAALRAQGTAVPQVISAFDGYASSLERTTTYSDDAAQAAMALLVQIGDVMPRDMEKAIGASANLAAALGIDLASAATIVAKAATGNTTALNKLGVETKDTEGKTKDFDKTLDAINKKFGGQAEAAANTYTGRIAQMANAWDNVKESVGRAVISNQTVITAIDLVKEALIGESGELNQNKRVMELVSDVTILAVRAAGFFIEAVAGISGVVSATMADLAGFARGLATILEYMNYINRIQGKWDPIVAKDWEDTKKVIEQLRGFSTGMLDARERVQQFTTSAQAMAARTRELADKLELTRGQTVDLSRATTTATRDLNAGTAALADNAAAQKRRAAAAEAAAKAEKAWSDRKRESMEDLWQEVAKAGVSFQTLGQAIDKDFMWPARQALDWQIEFSAHLSTLHSELGKTSAKFHNVGTVIQEATDYTGAMDVVTDRLAQLSFALSTIDAQWARMAEGGVAAAKQIKTIFNDPNLTGGQKLGASIETGLAVAGQFASGYKATGAIQGAQTGAAVGTMIMPGIGTAIGAGVGAVAGFFSGKSKEKKAMDEMRQALIDQVGGWEQLNNAAYAAGTSLERFMNAKGIKDTEAAVNELSSAITLQQTAMATLTETAQRYGFTLEELGPAMQRQELDKQAQQLFKDWEVLNAAGIDTLAITSRMSESISGYVNQAMAMGTEVPSAMQPMLQKMVEMGQLTDASGNRIDSLEDAGISFAMTMSEGFSALITEVGKLTDAIARGLGLAIDTTTAKVKGIPKTVDVSVNYHENRIAESVAEGSGGGADLESYQEGTEGIYRNFGRGTPVMLHGLEAVVPKAAPSSAGPPLLGSGSGGGAPVQIVINAQGAFFDTPGDLQRLADKVNEALTAKYGLTHRMRAA